LKTGLEVRGVAKSPLRLRNLPRARQASNIIIL
jgi:hypothetical protein